MRIGIYGGTFNPPHLGHIRGAQAAAKALCLDRLLLIPSYISPHKQLPEHSPAPCQRLEMVRLAAQGKPELSVSSMELDREGTSFTYQTVEQLREQYPEAQLFLLMGTDMFLSFLTWREPERITAQVTLAVMCRGDKGEKEAIAAQKALLEEKGVRVVLIDNPVIDISSTDLRRMLVMDCASEYLEPAVEQYIYAHGFYGAGEDLRGLSVEELEKAVVRLLKPDRVAHVLGCRQAAVSLARHYGVDETDAARAALLHDITKALDGPLQLTLCRKYGRILDEFSQANPKTLHALTGAMVARRIFGEKEAVVKAIESHTTGKADMNLLEAIIYVADYMEPNRDFPGVEELRQLAHADIYMALKRGLEMTLEMLHRQGRTVSPGSREALAWLEKKGR